MISNRVVLSVILSGLLISAEVGAQSYDSYQECKECHSDIFKSWSGSLHAKSYSNPAFQASYMSVLLDRGKGQGEFCLRCHAPAAVFEGDFDFRSPAAAEGVTCWFCHSVASVNEGHPIDTYYNLDTSGTMYGPYEPINPEGHEVAHSPLHLEAKMCAGCHEYTNDNGVGILETYNEWSESQWAKEEVYCQNCHMPIMVNQTAVDGRDVSSYYVTAHEFRGGMSNVNLTHAVKLETFVEREGSRLDVSVHITNAESGHKLPTGIPLRKLALTVVLVSAEHVQISSARKVYRKVLTDKFGTIIEDAPEMFLDATAIYSDNRIKPRETRKEEFVFLLPKGVDDYRIETVLNYEYTRPLLKKDLVRIEMGKNVVSSREIK